uniref:Uncharacterized protein n=1 Tax=Virus NIOZ-UU157 TaxID=2763269 RepID=A0A7S9XDT1_9VIRU|nr:MAG: hypothetical protein NIOZUU157_00159 [Virus NIOZ-UU157]
MKKLLLLLLLPIFSFSQNCVPTTIIINLDQYQSETYWIIEDTSGNMLTYGTNYGSQPDYASVVEQRCLPPGPLTFTIYDTYGDGLNGAMWGGLDGSYYVVQCYDTIVSGTNAAFGSDTAHAILVAPCPPIFGCMDSSYVEFNPRADTSDGSCSELVVFGCTDSTMYNYDSIANTMSLVPSCDYVLTLTDLVGDGWAASNLEVTQGDSVWNFTLDTAAYSQEYIINLKAPQEVSFKFSISQQAFQSAAHCGFKLTNPLGMTMIEVIPPFIQPLLKRTVPTYCGNYCIDKVFGCMDPLALNYVDTANTSTQCFYVLGCTNSSYLEYYTQGFVADTSDGSCEVKAEWGCTDSTAFNYDTIANIDNGGCIPVILGCMESLAFNFDPLANTPDTCVPLIYGCTDPTMFNFSIIANTDDGDCEPYVFGCTDSIMFNYNPLANSDNNSCIPFISGCTDPSMLNYNPSANTEDFSCIAYIYGCMDSTALNFDPLANTSNNSCVEIVMGCMDPNAYNYESIANVNDSVSCLYDANCFTGPGIPYWLNDPCYAWVISVDDYCCENEWDTICQATYDYCDGTWVGPLLTRVQTKKELIMITDLLGRPAKQSKNQLLFYIYNDGSVEKKIIKQ